MRWNYVQALAAGAVGSVPGAQLQLCILGAVDAAVALYNGTGLPDIWIVHHQQCPESMIIAKLADSALCQSRRVKRSGIGAWLYNQHM